MNKPFSLVKWNLSICARRHGNHIKNNLQSFCSFMHQISVGSWGSSPDPDGGACSSSPYLLAGQQGATPPAPSHGGGLLNFIQILHLAVCTLPYIHVYYGYATAWLSPLITCFAPPEHAAWLRAELYHQYIVHKGDYLLLDKIRFQNSGLSPGIMALHVHVQNVVAIYVNAMSHV